jgi:hypothetical protein
LHHSHHRAGGAPVADQITLKNGDRVTGKFVKTEGGKLVVATDLFGDVSVDLANVSNIATDQPLCCTRHA